jgi:hypothetical protein
MPQYRVRAPTAGLLYKRDGGVVSVTLPAGALLRRLSSAEPSLGMVPVVWERRKYSVSEKDLRDKCDLIQQASTN